MEKLDSGGITNNMEHLANPETYLSKRIESNEHKLVKIREKFSDINSIEGQANKHFGVVVFDKTGKVLLAKNSLLLTFEYNLPSQDDIKTLDQ